MTKREFQRKLEVVLAHTKEKYLGDFNADMLGQPDMQDHDDTVALLRLIVANTDSRVIARLAEQV